ncbi:MAG: PRC-barrel domain-containing protein [Desulfosarcina sp.]
MQRNTVTLATAFLAMVALIVSPVYATDETVSDQSKGTHMSSDKTKGSQMSGMAGHQGKQVSFRGSDLIGEEVVNRNDEEMGEVEDIVIGRDGRVSYVLISHGGVLGIGDNLIPVPFSAISRSAQDDDDIVIDMTKEELENAPNFAKNQWPDFDDDAYQNEVHGYYGGTPTPGSQGAGDMKTKKYDDKSSKKVSE